MVDSTSALQFDESLSGLDPCWRRAWKKSAVVGIYESGGLVDVVGRIICAVEAGCLTRKAGARALLSISRHPRVNERQDGELIAIWIAAGSITDAEGGDYDWQDICDSYRRLL